MRIRSCLVVVLCTRSRFKEMGWLAQGVPLALGGLFDGVLFIVLSSLLTSILPLFNRLAHFWFVRFSIVATNRSGHERGLELTRS
jgi:hypothetical protein